MVGVWGGGQRWAEVMDVLYGEHMGEVTTYGRRQALSIYIGDLEHRRSAGVADSTRCTISIYRR
jgi:hypothetical protein